MAKNSQQHLYLYILRLEQDKWYVGISTNVERRFKQHCSGFAGAAWTKKYKPLEIHDTRDLGMCGLDKAQLFEGRVTREYMKQYGDNNVRGGDLTSVDEYVRHFGYIWRKEDWKEITLVTVAVLIILYFSIHEFIVHGLGIPVIP